MPTTGLCNHDARGSPVSYSRFLRIISPGLLEGELWPRGWAASVTMSSGDLSQVPFPDTWNDEHKHTQKHLLGLVDPLAVPRTPTLCVSQAVGVHLLLISFTAV